MYEYIKRIIGFFLPITASGIYSAKELIQEILAALEGKPSNLKEIVDKTNNKFMV